ncbi:MAG: glycosyltransferase [Planctomycetota bacterium]
MELSIVTSLYRSEESVDDLYARLTQSAARMTPDYEIVFVNDGAPEASLGTVLRFVPADPHVRVLDLSRPFGHDLAVSAGCDFARGKRVFVIDVDEDPAWLDRFWQEMDRTGADVVYGVQTARKGSLFSDYSARAFTRLFNFVSDVRIPGDACTVRLMTRRYVDALQTLRDRALFLAGNYAWAGFRQHPIPVEPPGRTGPPAYGVFRRLDLFVRAVTAFTAYPLRLIFVLGVLFSLFGCGIALALVIRKLVDPSSVLIGWASLTASIWLLGGVIIAFLGVIGLYLSTAFIEAKDRPRFIVQGLRAADAAQPHGPPPGG